MKWIAGSAIFLCPLLSLFLCTISLDPNQIQVFPENGGISGVFIAMPKSKIYSFDSNTAAKVCVSLNVRIATKAEVETAQSNGLQTCRYGWVKEQMGVIPRIEENEKCGQKRVGVIVWAAQPTKLFDVFCFNSTGQREAATAITPRMTKPTDRSPQSHTTSPSLIQSTLFNKNFLPPSPSAPSISRGFSTSAASTFFLPTVGSAATRRPQSLLPSTTQYSLPTSSSSSAISLASTILSSHSFTYSSPLYTLSDQTDQPARPPSKSSFEEVPTACVIIAIMLILMAGAGGVWYFKIKRAHRLPPWVRIQQKDTAETEMWKHTDQPRSSKKKESRNSSDDITLQLEEDTESP